MNLWRILTGVVLVFGMANAATAENRIALVIGNGAYTSVTPLDNPVSDATLIAATLSGLGFEVTLVTDATQTQMTGAIGAFGKALRKAGPEATGLFYYAGHGVQSFKTNYILPVDVALTDPADLGLVGVEAESILRQMFSARNKTNIVILDACRNNPFEALPDLDDNGLAEMKAPTGTFLAYATEPGAVALDGVQGNSPFTQALAQQMQVPAAPIEQMFKQVRVRVIDATGGAQTPWDTSSLTSDFSFNPAEVLSDQQVAEMQLWNSVRLKRDPAQLALFLQVYPDSGFAADARTLLAAIAPQTAATVVAPAPTPAPPNTAPVSFTLPLDALEPPVTGKSIAQLLKLTPIYPPIEGLDASIWQDKACTTCHEWTRDALCTQATTYLADNAERALSKQHPFGGAFKQALRSWARGGCE